MRAPARRDPCATPCDERRAGRRGRGRGPDRGARPGVRCARPVTRAPRLRLCRHLGWVGNHTPRPRGRPRSPATLPRPPASRPPPTRPNPAISSRCVCGPCSARMFRRTCLPYPRVAACATSALSCRAAPGPCVPYWVLLSSLSRAPSQAFVQQPQPSVRVIQSMPAPQPEPMYAHIAYACPMNLDLRAKSVRM